MFLFFFERKRFYVIAHRGKTTYPSVWYVTMAFPTGTIGAIIYMRSYPRNRLGVGNLVGVATDAVALHRLLSCFMHHNYLRFSAKRVNGGVIEAVFCFEGVLLEHVIVRNMAVVATGDFTV